MNSRVFTFTLSLQAFSALFFHFCMATVQLDCPATTKGGFSLGSEGEIQIRTQPTIHNIKSANNDGALKTHKTLRSHLFMYCGPSFSGISSDGTTTTWTYIVLRDFFNGNFNPANLTIPLFPIVDSSSPLDSFPAKFYTLVMTAIHGTTKFFC